MVRKLIIFTLVSVFSVVGAIAQKQEVAITEGATTQLTFFAGSTSVHLSADFRGALTTLQISPSRIFPGRLSGSRAKFPIIDGTIDASTLRGEIVHSGGLSLRKGTTKVKLQSFIIDTTGPGIVLTGLVSANGSVVGRIPLFDLALSGTSNSSNFDISRISLDNVTVTLRPEAAAALNSVFNITAFTAGFNIGTASVDGLAYGT